MKNIKLFAVILTLITVQSLGYLSINHFGDYGWTVFLVLPLIIGFLPPFLVGRQMKISKGESYFLSFGVLALAGIALLIFAYEGAICLAMALPLLVPVVVLGSYLGLKISGSKTVNHTNTSIFLLFFSLGSLVFDYHNQPTELRPVTTKIVVNSPIDEVWMNVVTFDEIYEPVDWIFKTGIAYPINAQIKGHGVGAIRYCNFNTGSFVEPITVWDKPNLLRFDVQEQPIPMNEFNPFWEVHPPHLDGYFKSYKGQFKLTRISENRTELEGTTWYKVDIYPTFYWQLWSDFIIHRIHRRVLVHIKNETESPKI